MALKACSVVVHDLNETAHSLDVTAESLYEAIAQALAALRGHEWVGDIGTGLTTVSTINPESSRPFIGLSAGVSGQGCAWSVVRPESISYKIRANDGNVYILRYASSRPDEEWVLVSFRQTG